MALRMGHGFSYVRVSDTLINSIVRLSGEDLVY